MNLDLFNLAWSFWASLSTWFDIGIIPSLCILAIIITALIRGIINSVKGVK